MPWEFISVYYVIYGSYFSKNSQYFLVIFALFTKCDSLFQIVLYLVELNFQYHL